MVENALGRAPVADAGAGSGGGALFWCEAPKKRPGGPALRHADREGKGRVKEVGKERLTAPTRWNSGTAAADVCTMRACERMVCGVCAFHS